MPKTGLTFDDVKLLIQAMQNLRYAGNPQKAAANITKGVMGDCAALYASLPRIFFDIAKAGQSGVLDPDRPIGSTDEINHTLDQTLRGYAGGALNWERVSQSLGRIVSTQAAMDAVCAKIYEGLDNFLDVSGRIAHTMDGVDDPSYVMVRPGGAKGIFKVTSVSEEPGYKIFGKVGSQQMLAHEFWHQYWTMPRYGQADATDSKRLREKAIGALFTMLRSIVEASSKLLHAADSSAPDY
jgi:hypothetical protein